MSISIIGILCAISLPSLMSFYYRKADENVLSQLLHALAFAHHEALIKGLPVGMCQSKNRKHCTDGNWQDGYIIFLDLYEDGSVRSKDQLLAVRSGLKSDGSLHYRAYPLYRSYVLFKSQEWLKNDNGTFWYCLHNNPLPAWAIFLTKSGKTRVAYPDKEGEIKDMHRKILRCSKTMQT